MPDEATIAAAKAATKAIRGARSSDLLRLATAGSVDDGKSTLIGRLLYDSKTLFIDQLAAVERVSRGTRPRLHGPRAAHRRPARRAGAGDHDRRRVPLLRHAAAAVHHRGHPRAHPVHAEHGHRRLHGGRRGPPAGCPPRDHRAESPARVHRLAAGRAPHPAVRQQDGPGRLVGGRVRVDPRGVRRVRHAPARPRPLVHPDLGPARRQRRGAVREDALVRRAAAAPPPRAPVRRLRSKPRRRSIPDPVRHPARSRTPSSTTAAMPGPSPPACSSRAIRCWCCRAGSRRRSSRSRPPTDRSTRHSRRWP